MVGAVIQAYGQKVSVDGISEVFVNHKRVITVLLKHPIVVPGTEYTRDYIILDEIQEILT